MSEESVFYTHRAFITAAGEHFGVPADQLMMGSKVDGGVNCDAPFQVCLMVALTPDDVSKISLRVLRNIHEENKDPASIHPRGKQ